MSEPLNPTDPTAGAHLVPLDPAGPTAGAHLVPSDAVTFKNEIVTPDNVDHVSD